MTRRHGDGGTAGLYGFVFRHPVTVFLLWFFIVGQAVVFVPVVGGANGADLPVTPFVIASTLIGLLLPAVVITWIVEGPAGVAALLRCAARAQVGLGWYSLALFAAPLTAVGITVVVFGPPVDASAAVLASAVLLGLGFQTLLGFVTNNLAEEIAWMGFVQARLGDRHGPLAAAVLTAPLFALQHLALAVDNAGAGAGALILVLLLIVFAIPFRAWMAWLRNRSHSLLIVGLAHAAGNAAASGAGVGEGLLPRLYPDRSVGPMHIFAFAVLGVFVLTATRGRLGDFRTQRPARSDTSARRPHTDPCENYSGDLDEKPPRQ